MIAVERDQDAGLARPRRANEATPATIALRRIVRARRANRLMRSIDQRRSATIPATTMISLVVQDRDGIGAEEGAGDDGQRIEQPEAEDRLQREPPVGEARRADRSMRSF